LLALASVALTLGGILAGRGARRGFDITIGTMAATAAATVPTAAQVSSGKHVKSVLDVIIPTFDEG
jgi:hypothetical protein